MAENDPPSSSSASRSATSGSSNVFREGDIVGGKFRLEKVIGEGGMAVVVAATHLKLDERVALKFLRREALENPEVKARFAHEARAIARLRSEHIARVQDVGETDDGVPFLVMDLLEGKDLGRHLAESGKLPLKTAVEYTIQAAEGLAEAHARGIVHRDVKPENLFLVERDGIRHVKLLDFGISQPSRGQDPEIAAVATGKLFGSPVYMSPEQLREGAEIDIRCDLWSLGIVLFELLSGETPFDSKLPLESMVGEILYGLPRSLADVGIDIPPAIEGIVGRCLQREAKDRFQSAAEVAVALVEFGPRRSRNVAEKALLVSRAARLCSDSLSLPPTVPPPSRASTAADAPAPAARPAPDVVGVGPEVRAAGADAPAAHPEPLPLPPIVETTARATASPLSGPATTNVREEEDEPLPADAAAVKSEGRERGPEVDTSSPVVTASHDPRPGAEAQPATRARPPPWSQPVAWGGVAAALVMAALFAWRSARHADTHDARFHETAATQPAAAPPSAAPALSVSAPAASASSPPEEPLVAREPVTASPVKPVVPTSPAASTTASVARKAAPPLKGSAGKAGAGSASKKAEAAKADAGATVPSSPSAEAAPPKTEVPKAEPPKTEPPAPEPPKASTQDAPVRSTWGSGATP